MGLIYSRPSTGRIKTEYLANLFTVLRIRISMGSEFDGLLNPDPHSDTDPDPHSGY